MESAYDNRPGTAGHRRTRSRGLSFKSDKSAGSAGKGKVKLDLKESADEKRRNHMSLGTKANPNAAMNEAQPIAAALEESTLPSLRAINMDSQGNSVEPDRSNPTRSRWERPLDTIRSFEKAIDSEYQQKRAIQRQETSGPANGYESRRSSYYGGNDHNPQARYSQAGNYFNGGRNRDSFSDYDVPRAPPPRNRFSQRVQYDYGVNRYSGMQHNGHGPSNGYAQNQPYPNQAYHNSRDTVNSSEPWTNNTDPSSENSSIDRVHHMPQKSGSYPDFNEQQYGMSGIQENGEYAYPQAPRSRGRMLDGQYAQNSHYGGGPPPVPPHAGAQRNGYPQQQERPPPMKLGGSASTAPQWNGVSNGQTPPAVPLKQTSGNNRQGLQKSDSKRKSWFKRRFSKD